MNFQVVADFGGDKKLLKPTSRPTGKFLVVNPDFNQVWEDGRTGISRNTRNGVPYNAVSGKAVPATCRFIDDRFVRLDCALQEWMFELCRARISSTPMKEAKNSWASLTRDNAYITNYAGSWSRRDCINGANLDQDFMQLQPMVTGGTLLKFVDETSKAFLVEAINPFVEYLMYSPQTHAWLFYEPTLSARYWVEQEKKNNPNFANDGHPDKTTLKQEWYSEPFPQFKENVVLAVFGMIPHAKSGTGFVNSVDKKRVRFLGENEKVPNPFVMRFGRSRRNPYEGF